MPVGLKIDYQRESIEQQKTGAPPQAAYWQASQSRRQPLTSVIDLQEHRRRRP